LRGGAVKEPSVVERLRAAVEHLESLIETMGAHSGLRHARKHLAAYAEFAGAESADPRRQRLVTTDETAEALSLLESLFLDPPTARAA